MFGADFVLLILVSGVKSMFRADFVLLTLFSGVKSMFRADFVLLILVSGVKSTLRADLVLLTELVGRCGWRKVFGICFGKHFVKSEYYHYICSPFVRFCAYRWAQIIK